MSKIIWKGINSDSIKGLLISELPPISKPKMKTTITKIDGRDGDVIEELGYESYIKTLKIGLTKDYDLDLIIKYFSGSGDLILSNESNRIYKCAIVDKIDYEKLLRFKKATIKFHTQPFKYLNNEEIIDLDISDETSLIVENKGLEISKPIIKLIGSGTIEVAINNSTFLIYKFPDDENEVTIDSQEEEAYLDGIYKNRNMTGIFPLLKPGKNSISWSGNLSKIIIEPKSRWL